MPKRRPSDLGRTRTAPVPAGVSEVVVSWFESTTGIEISEALFADSAGAASPAVVAGTDGDIVWTEAAWPAAVHGAEADGWDFTLSAPTRTADGLAYAYAADRAGGAPSKRTSIPRGRRPDNTLRNQAIVSGGLRTGRRATLPSVVVSRRPSSNAAKETRRAAAGISRAFPATSRSRYSWLTMKGV